jgi:hypothetical protein
VTIDGGVLAGEFAAATGSQVTIAGGVFDGEFRAWSGSLVNIVSTRFTLGEADLIGLEPGEAFIFEARDVELAGNFADGTPFRFDLNSSNATGSDRFDPNALLTVTLVVPEPTAYCLACLAAILAGAFVHTLPRGR